MRYIDARNKAPLAEKITFLPLHDLLEKQGLGFLSSVIVEDTREVTNWPFTVYYFSTSLAAVEGNSFETLKEAEDWNHSRKI